LGLLLLLGPSILCASEFVVNGGFEGGTYSSTIGGNTNGSVPVGWTPNAGFDLEPGFNHVASGNQYAGSYDLSISNYDFQPLAALSQTFTDVSGATYSGSFYAYDGGAGGDGNAFLSVLVNGTPYVTLDDTVNAWTQYSFTFTGTGSDTLTIEAQTNPAEWYVDNVSVTGQASAVTPEPCSLLLFGTFLTGAGFFRRRLTGPSLR
jgi:hypothetical protein